MFLLFTIGKISLEKSPFGRLLKSINMDHIWIAFALRVVFAVKIWKKTSMIVWTTKCGPDYHTSFFPDFYSKNYPESKNDSYVVHVNRLEDTDDLEC